MEKREIKNIAVVGAGLMGRGIAQFLAQKGLKVNLIDLKNETLKTAMKMIESSLETMVSHNEINKDDKNNITKNISTFTDLNSGVANADMVIESATELIEVKEKIFQELHKSCREDAIITTNTSALDVFGLVHESRQKNIIATHFFAPAEIIPLVEICPGPETDKKTVDLVDSFFKQTGKTTIVMEKFVPSFIVNRIQTYIGMAVFEMLGNGWADPHQIDLAVKSSLGIRLPVVGVLQTLDFTGLEVVQEMINNHNLNIPIVQEMIDQGNLGVKTSKGFYDYQGRTEKEILAKRDTKYLEVKNFLSSIKSENPL